MLLLLLLLLLFLLLLLLLNVCRRFGISQSAVDLAHHMLTDVDMRIEFELEQQGKTFDVRRTHPHTRTHTHTHTHQRPTKQPLTTSSVQAYFVLNIVAEW